MDGEPSLCLSLAQAQTGHVQALERRISSNRPELVRFSRRLHVRSLASAVSRIEGAGAADRLRLHIMVRLEGFGSALKRCRAG
jgi:hypothetical protein